MPGGIFRRAPGTEVPVSPAGTSCLPVLAGGGGDASGRAGQAVPVRVQVGRVHLAADVAFGNDGPPAPPPPRVGRQGGRTAVPA